MSSSRSTGCPPREARGVCPSLPRGDTRKMITECPPREAQGVLLAKHGVSTDITVCPSHTAQCRNVPITNCAISRGVSVTLCRVMLRCVRHTLRYSTQCVHHTPPVAHCAISRSVQSYTCKMITECPPREAWGVLLAKHGVSITQRVTDITRPMWCMPALYILQHSSSASPSLSYNLINKQASYYSIKGVSWTVGNGTGS